VVPRSHSWRIYSNSAAPQIATVGEHGLQIIKTIPQILLGFLRRKMRLDIFVQCSILLIIPGFGRARESPERLR
jgi:hypothetical protein